MKSNKLRIALLGFLLALVVAGCASAPRRLTLPPPSTATPAPPTATPTPSPSPTPSPTPTPTPLVRAPEDGLPHYTLEVNLDYYGRSLQVAQGVRLQNSTLDTWEEVVLAVPPAHQAGVFAITAAPQVTTAWARHPVTPTLEDIMLHLPLPVPVGPGEAVEVRFAYTLGIPPVAPTDWPPVGNFGASERLLQAGDWLPTVVPYDAGEGWRTWTYRPVGDPIVYQAADYDVLLRVAPEVVVAAPGENGRVGEARRYHLEEARTFAFLASPEYRAVTGTVGTLPITSYYLPPYEAAGRGALEVAVNSVALFTERYGPYPYPELIVAQNAYYGGMEYSGLVTISGYAYETYTGAPTDLLVSLTSHEVAHEWWYGAVGNDQVRSPWLDEALAKYSEVLYYERYAPSVVDWWWRAHIDYWDPTAPLDSTLYDFSSTATFIHELYGRGARFIRDLRALMGDEGFFAFLQDYQRQGRGRLMTTEDFFAIAGAHTDADLTPLRQSYFSGP